MVKLVTDDLAGARDFFLVKCADAGNEFGRQSGRNTQGQIYFSVTFIFSWLISIDTIDKTQQDRKASHQREERGSIQLSKM